MRNPFDEMWERLPGFIGFVLLVYIAISFKSLAWWWLGVPLLALIPITVYFTKKAEAEKSQLRAEEWQRKQAERAISASEYASINMTRESIRQNLLEEDIRKEQESAIDKKYRVSYLFWSIILLILALMLKGCGHAFFK